MAENPKNWRQCITSITHLLDVCWSFQTCSQTSWHKGFCNSCVIITENSEEIATSQLFRWISLFSAVLDFLIFSIGLHYFQHFHFMKSLQLGIKVISEEVAIQAKVIYASFFKLPPFGTFSKVDISPNLSSQSSGNLNNLHLFPSTFNLQNMYFKRLNQKFETAFLYLFLISLERGAD